LATAEAPSLKLALAALGTDAIIEWEWPAGNPYIEVIVLPVSLTGIVPPVELPIGNDAHLILIIFGVGFA